MVLYPTQQAVYKMVPGGGDQLGPSHTREYTRSQLCHKSLGMAPKHGAIIVTGLHAEDVLCGWS